MVANRMADTEHRFLTPAARGALGLAAAVAVAVIVLGRIARWLIVDAIGPDADRTHLSIAGTFVQLRYSVNSGIAFGLLQDRPAIAGWLAGLVIVPIFLVLVYLAARGRWWAVASGLVLGGAAGNLIDRAANGSVTDYIMVGRWPSFNIADAAITVGALVLFGLSWRESPDESNREGMNP